MHTVVVVREPVARWYRRLDDGAYECHSCGTTDTAPISPPAWLPAAPNDKAHPVAVVIDHPGEDIEIQPLQQHGSCLRRWQHRYALTASLRARYPQAEIAQLRLDADNDAVAVTHRNWPASLKAWFARHGKLCAGSAETLGRRLARFETQCGDSVYFLIVEQEICRHLYCRGRLRLFSRRADTGSDEALSTQYEECCEHLDARGLLDKPILVVTAGLSPAAAARIARCEHTRTLLDLDELLPACNDTDMLSLAAAVSRLEPTPQRILARLVGACTGCAAGITSHDLPLADPWIAAVQGRRASRRQRLYLQVSLALLLFAGVVAAARTHTAWMRLRTDIALRQDLQASIDTLAEQTRQLDKTPHLTAEVLAARERLLAQSRPAPRRQLLMLARLLRDFPDLSLSALLWRLVSVTDGVTGSVAPGMALGVDARRRLPGAEEPDVQWQLTLSGAVKTQHSLRRRQQRLRAFCDRLRRLPNVVSVEILQSALDVEKLPAAILPSAAVSMPGSAGSGFTLLLRVTHDEG